MQATNVLGAGGSVGTSVASGGSVALVPGVTSGFGLQAARIMVKAINIPKTIIVRLRAISFLLSE
jgi:hypothetical protein